MAAVEPLPFGDVHRSQAPLRLPRALEHEPHAVEVPRPGVRQALVIYQALQILGRASVVHSSSFTRPPLIGQPLVAQVSNLRRMAQDAIRFRGRRSSASADEGVLRRR